MRALLAKIPYSPLLVLAVFLAVAPVTPQPHLVEKLGLLFRGELTRPLDIFDLLFHAAPLILLALKFILTRQPADKNGR